MRNKIHTLEELALLIADARKTGKKVAHCHGCFDLLHFGHMKHFEAARKDADILVVTVTPDRYVNKGPGRPIFPENMRMEALAALETVDYVALNRWPTAIETLQMLKPDFYVKGQEYKDESKDITGNIALERQAVEAGGGSIYYTEEIVFSSSSLINAHFNPRDSRVQDFLTGFRNTYSSDDVVNALESLKKLKVLVIGDTIIDEYHTCRPLGKSSKSPTISSMFLRGTSYAGGVLAIANHLEQFAGNVEMVTVLGTENTQKDLIDEKLSAGVQATYFMREDGPTPTKRRYLDEYLNLKLFEVTFMNDQHIDASLEKQIIEHLSTRLERVDMVMIADFGHGLITPGIIKFLEKSGKYLAVNAQTNSNNYGFNYITKYNRADYISIDEKELRLPFGDNYGELNQLIEKLKDISHCESIQITLGGKGSVLRQNGIYYQAPAFAISVRDSVGAGDAVLSVTSLMACQGCDPALIPFVGNCTGALAVEIIGNEHPVYRKDLLKFISHLLK